MLPWIQSQLSLFLLTLTRANQVFRSRVVATSASDNYFALFMLKSPREIQLQLAQNDLDPIKAVRGLH